MSQGLFWATAGAAPNASAHMSPVSIALHRHHVAAPIILICEPILLRAPHDARPHRVNRSAATIKNARAAPRHGGR